MPKKSEQPLQMWSGRLNAADIETMNRFYGPNIGTNRAIRTLVERHCRKLLEKSNRSEETHELSIDDTPSLDELLAAERGEPELD